MESLAPIKSIPVNFGKPMDFSPPLTEAFKARILAIVKDWKAHKEDAIMEEHDFWQASLSPQERAEYNRLDKEREECRKAYDPKIHTEDSDEFRFYCDADNSCARYADSVGKHMCLACSSFCASPKDRDDVITVCDHNHSDKGILPFSLACEHFTTDITPEMEEAARDLDKLRRLAPKKYAQFKRLRELNLTREFVKELQNFPCDAFYRVSLQPDFYFSLFEKFPTEFADTMCPTLESFKATFEEWKEDSTITKEDEGHVTLSISKTKFAPTTPSTTRSPSPNQQSTPINQ